MMARLLKSEGQFVNYAELLFLRRAATQQICLHIYKITTKSFMKKQHRKGAKCLFETVLSKMNYVHKPNVFKYFMIFFFF